MYTVDNAIIMAAGTSSRFAPLSFERPKSLIEVKGEVLIERQIRQLREAGIKDIIIVTGYKAEQFAYLQEKFGVKLIHNPEFNTRNNNASVYVAREFIRNTFLCSADNYFSVNPFSDTVESAYYAAVHTDGSTEEWCLHEDEEGFIDRVTIGGSNAWYMMGHTFWSADFSERFLSILEDVYELPETADALWEAIYIAHLDQLKMNIRRYGSDEIFEFDSLDELRAFDTSYRSDTRSPILKAIAAKLDGDEAALTDFRTIKSGSNEATGFRFSHRGQTYAYRYDTGTLTRE